MPDERAAVEEERGLFARGSRLLERARRLRGWNRRPRLLVLGYHRVAALETDPQRLAVTPEHFAGQLEVLGARFHPLPLVEALARLARGDLPERAVALTFDDGYEDNVTLAYPLLARHGVPASIFIATGWIDSRQEFYWDEVERILLSHGELPRTLDLDDARTWELGEAARLSTSDWARYRRWNHQLPPPTARHRVYLEVLKLLSRMGEAPRMRALAQLRRWGGAAPEGRATHRPLGRAGIAALARDPLIDVGGHSVAHTRLARLGTTGQAHEAMACRLALEGITGRPVTSFSYPFGGLALDALTVAAVRYAGFRVACTTTPALATPDTSALLVPRFYVRDFDAARFASRLEQWWERRW